MVKVSQNNIYVGVSFLPNQEKSFKINVLHKEIFIRSVLITTWIYKKTIRRLCLVRQIYANIFKSKKVDFLFSLSLLFDCVLHWISSFFKTCSFSTIFQLCSLWLKRSPLIQIMLTINMHDNYYNRDAFRNISNI